MALKIFFLLAALVYCDCAYVYSSFWAPLFNPRILNYNVDINFDPDSGKNAREEYQSKYGYRGEKLIADFGNAKGPSQPQNKDYEDVKFYYTYDGADRYNL